jgi:uncharacterized Tic20 family protein
MLVKSDSPTARAHAVAALNFQLLWSIISVVGSIVAFCGTFIIIGALFWVVPVAAAIIGIVFGVIAGIRANEGELYRYPMSATFIR